MAQKKFIKTSLQEYLKSEKVNEASFGSFNNDDILTDDFMLSCTQTGADILIDWYKSEKGLEDAEDSEGLSSPEFLDFLKNELEKNLEEAKEKISNVINWRTNKVTLYRAITVDDSWLEHLKTQGKRLGIYWSWDEEGAEAHWGDYKKNKVAKIEVEIDEKYVDWKITLQMNTSISFKEEKEIRLFKNTPLKIKKLSIDDEEIDVSMFNGKTFYA